MNRLVSMTECKLTDEELINKVDQMTDEMFKSRKVPPRNIPARPESDYDLLIGHLLRRFHKYSKEEV